MGDLEYTLHICRGCGSHAWWAEDIVHVRQQCRGERDATLIESLVLVPKGGDQTINASSPALALAA